MQTDLNAITKVFYIFAEFVPLLDSLCPQNSLILFIIFKVFCALDIVLYSFRFRWA